MREKTQRSFIYLFLAGSVLLGAAVLADSGGRRGKDEHGRRVGVQRPERVDSYGRPVFDQDGRPRNYDRDETPVDIKAAGHGTAPRFKSTLQVDPEWHHVIFGVGIGDTGLRTADLTGDGVLEIAAAAGPMGSWANDYWYILQESGGDYRQVWASTQYGEAITSLLTYDLDGDGDAEVLLGVGGDVLVYDVDSQGQASLVQTVATASSSVLGLTVADVDSDGALELVFCNSASLWVYGASTGLLEYQGAGFGGKDVAVGNVDADPGLEIVIGNDTSTGYVLDGATHAVEWTNPSGFGTYVATGDLDGDAMEEIVAGYRWYNVNAYDADLQTLAWNIPLNHDLGALRLFDWDGDGGLDVVLGEAQWGSILVHDGATGAFMDSISNPGHGTTDVAFGDVDSDGQNEVLWGTGYTSSAADYLYVVDAATHVFEWTNLDVSGPFYGLGSGDVDADGATELFYTTFESESGYGDGYYFVHDGAGKDLEYESGEVSASNFNGVYRIAAAQIDGDPQQELIVTTGSGYSGWLVAFDGLTHAQQWQVAIESGLSFQSLQVADVDSDGSLEVVAGTGREHTGATGVYVYVYDAATGALEWQSPSLGSGFIDCVFLRVGQVDGDAAQEILAGIDGGALQVFDGQSHLLELQTGDLDLSSLAVADRDGDGQAEILVGKDSGLVQVLDPATGAVTENVGSFGGGVHGLTVEELTGDGVADYVFAVNDEVRALDGQAGTFFWTSGVIGSDSGALATPVGESDSLVVADLDGDGQKEVFVNLGYVGVRVYEIELNLDPTVAILAPAGGSSIFDSLPVDFEATASDPEDGDLSAAVAWTSDLDGALGSGASLEVTALSVGTHTITASVTDSGGLPASDSIVLEIVPNTAPAVAISSPSDGTVALQGTSVSFAGTATDAEEGDLAASLVWTSSLDGTIGTGAGFGRSDLTAGTHTITASVTDAGNLTGSASITLVVNAAPSVSISSPADGSLFTSGDLVTFTGSASDAEDGDLSTSISWSSDLDGAIGVGASFATSSLSPGVHTITASVLDSHGAPASASVTVTINVAPSVTITSPADGAVFTFGGLVTFTGSASDAEDGDLSASISWSSDLDGAIGTGASVGTSSLSPGVHTITASVTDSHGAPASASITLTINVAPSVSILAPADGSSSTETDPVTFTGTASDAEDGDLTAAIGWTSSLDGAIGSGGSLVTTSLSLGTHTITASVLDSHGAPASATITVSVYPNTPPVVTILTPADGDDFTIGDTVTFTGTVLDAQDGDLSAALSWSSSRDGFLGTGSSVATSSLSLGSHTVTASVVDHHGATGLASITILVRPLPVQVTLVSIATEDGWVRELAAGAGVGDKVDDSSKNNSGLRLGDDNQDRQARSFVSFDTSSIPDGAEVQEVRLELVLGTVNGTDPFTTHGTCWVDVETGGFSGSTVLESGDFEVSATAVHSGSMSGPSSGVSEALLDAAGLLAVNKLGTTQMRIYFELATNGNGGNDYAGFYAADTNDPSRHPRLVVTYQEY